MNKSPAFQFYASDFLVDTAEMTNQEVGAYIRLLSHQWVNGGLNGNPNRLANAVGVGLLEVWDDIKHKFELCDDGKYRNPKLEKVRQAQINYRNKQSEAGKKGAAKRWDGNPNGNPNGKKVALQSSSSSSVSQKKEVVVFNLPNWISGEVWKAFVEHRQKLKAPMTNHAKNLMVKKLGKLDSNADDILNQSISNGWKGVFEIKPENGNGSHQQTNKPCLAERLEANRKNAIEQLES